MNSHETGFRDTLATWLELVMRGHFNRVNVFAKEHGLSFSRMSTLFRLEKKGCCTVSDISRQLEITNAAASQLLEKLVQAGLIQRYEEPGDRRLRLHRITDEGRNLLDQLKASQTGWIQLIEESMGDDEKRSVAASLALLCERMRAIDESVHIVDRQTEDRQTDCPENGTGNEETEHIC